VLDQIRTSMRLHRTTRVILMLHSDCGAYGGLEAFGGDAAAERENHRSEMRKAREVLRAALPELTVEGYYVDFEGVWGVSEPEAARGA
jgi:hypothetical protein